MLSEDKDCCITNRRRTGGLLSGVMLLTLSTLICKVIGLLFKIPIINIVGIDGMAYFSSAYNIYMLLNSIAAAGLPVALSIMVSKNRAIGNNGNIRKIFISALSLFLILGLLGALALFFGADAYSDIIGIEKSSLAVKAIAPTLLFICISGALRGFFQGYEVMAPTAVSQLLESLGKLVLGVGFALFAVNRGLDSSFTAAAAISGLSAGVLISVVYLLIHMLIFTKRRRNDRLTDVTIQTDSNKKILFDLFVIAFPITISSCVTSLTSLADTALITNRLIVSGFSSDAAVALYSSYTNLAIPLFNLPPALITSIGISLIPALTGAIARGEEHESKKIFTSSVRLCNAFAIPAAAGIAIFAKPILSMIYPKEVDACAFAAPLLSILSVAIVFSCLTTVYNATLQAYMRPTLPIVSMGVGAVVKIVVEYLLVGSDLGIFGAPISTVACTFTILILDIVFLTVCTPQRFELHSLLRTLSATVFGVGLSAILYRILLNTDINASFSLFLSILAAVCMYCFFALLFGVVRYSDLASIAIGKQVADLLKRIRMIKE